VRLQNPGKQSAPADTRGSTPATLRSFSGLPGCSRCSVGPYCPSDRRLYPEQLPSTLLVHALRCCAVHAACDDKGEAGEAPDAAGQERKVLEERIGCALDTCGHLVFLLLWEGKHIHHREARHFGAQSGGAHRVRPDFYCLSFDDMSSDFDEFS